MPDTAEPAEDRQAKADSAGTRGASALVIARGAAAGLLAAAATEAGCGEVVIVPSDSVALVRLLRASAPPRFVLADTGGIGGSFVPLLRTMADPDLDVPLLLRLDPLKGRRALGVAHHLGLTAAVVSVDSGVAELAASLAGLREAAPSVPADALTAEALTSAIVARNIVTRYQPQVRLADAEPLALEALARWEHPVRGLLGAAEFVPLAEGAGLGATLADRVMRSAVEDLAALHRRGVRLRMAFNLPLDVLLHPATADRLAEAVASAGLPAEALTIELTESQIAHDLGAVRAAALRLRDQRFGVSIDDFSLNAAQAGLVSLPFSEMKLDRSLVLAARDDRAARGALGAVVRMAHRLGLLIVAEGIETPATWQMARDLGADLAQGWMVGRPMPAVAVPAWLAAWQRAIALGAASAPASSAFGA
ncbi:EAL domain-containing protein [Elioraea tepida]|uniref:EAL domain-containing protein n=1 Tax=Elioraea tepida TaxID=2843330 RepID=A0A975U1I4_9PROT|nr:EAL domain-containing protein [Elioraea tepida]QXM24599.1 EAL domain-containing protein [Elioraea tepida]